MKFVSIQFLTLGVMLASAQPARRAAFDLANGQEAIALNTNFLTRKAGDACDPVKDQNTCAGVQFAQCVNGKILAQDCAPGTQCAAIPLTNAPGTLVQCVPAAELASRLAATGATGAGTTPPPASPSPAVGDIQTSLTLDPSVIATGFASDGQDPPKAGQSPSLTSTNNFINFCAGKTITDGKQLTGGSCNPAPIGDIPSTAAMPSSKFVDPPNGGTVKADTAFTITMNIKNLITGNFVNAQASYFAAPQQLQGGQILGHSHVVIEKLTALDQTEATQPEVFAYFKGLNGKADNGALTADVTNGLPAGAYRLCSINSSSNHQPVIVPIAQRGSLDDCVYFTSA